MNIQQLEYAVEASRTLSFSAAAENLFVSQPNISRAISALEAELGYQIFSRTNQGLILTEEGEYFIQHAEIIAEQLRQIKGSNLDKNCSRLNIISSFNHTALSEAFIKLCRAYDSHKRLDFSMASGNVKQVINEVYLNKCQIGITAFDDKAMKVYGEIMKAKGISMIPLKKVHMNINLRKGHPVLKNGIENVTLNQLKDYAHISYDFSRGDEYPSLLYMDSIDTSKKISVHDKETRRRLVSSTNAFSVGCVQHPTANDHSNWVSIQIPGISCNIVYIKKNSGHLGGEALQYIELLQKELDCLE